MVDGIALVVLGAAATASPLWAAVLGGDDQVVLRNGLALHGSIGELRGRQLSMQVRVGQTKSLGTSARTVPTQEIERVWFEERLAGIEDSGLEALERFWEKRRAYLPLPGSEAADAGLRLARRLLARGETSGARRAESVAREVSRRVSEVNFQHEARCVEAEALALQGLLDEAEAVLEAEAPFALEKSDGTAHRQAWARLAWGRVLALEARHPRWKDDPEVLEQHMEWVDAAMAGALQAFLFEPDNAAASAAGLEDAFLYLMRLNREEEAAVYAEDLASFYPDSPAGVRAKEWLGVRERSADQEGGEETAKSSTETKNKGVKE